MKIFISKVKALKKNYQLVINNKEYIIDAFYYETLLPYDNKEIDLNTYEDIIAISKANVVLNKSYKKIFNNELSLNEFKDRLVNASLEDDEIKRITYYLIKEGYLNDENLIKHYLDVYEKIKGVIAFKSLLIKKKVNYRLIEKYISDYNENKEYALEYSNAFIKNKTGSKQMLKLKLKASLINKGFSEETIDYVLDNLNSVDDKKSLIKEALKYQRQYKNDYYKIVNKLVAKGYKLSDVKNIISKEGVINED